MHSVPTVAVVLEQLAASNPLASASVSLDSFTQFADGFMSALAFQFGLRLVLCQPDNASKQSDDGDDSAANSEQLDHFTAFLAA